MHARFFINIRHIRRGQEFLIFTKENAYYLKKFLFHLKMTSLILILTFIVDYYINFFNQIINNINASDGKIAIAAHSGVIFPEIVKLEGKKSQSISDFINGNRAFLDFSFN